MPNFLEIGEIGLAVGRTYGPKIVGEASAALTREVTAILERGAALTPDALPGLSRYLSGAARADLPNISKTLGLTGKNEGGDVIIGRLDRYGKDAPSLFVYEPHRNVLIRGDGSIHVVSPTPSGQSLRSQNFNWKGPYEDVNTRARYVRDVKQAYPTIPHPKQPGFGMLSDVITHPDSRQFGVGMMNWISEKKNFMPSKDLIDAVKATRPVEVSSAKVNEVLGQYISNPQASGWLLGFDKNAGEAIVGFGNWPTAGFETWFPRNPVVKDLTKLYPVELSAYKAPNITAYRNELGQLFSAEPVPGGFRLAPAGNTLAFMPSEIGLGYDGLRLSTQLGLSSNTGLRAMGGYATATGGRIPISVIGR